MNKIINFLSFPAVANDFPFAFRESLVEGFNFPQVWSSRGSGFGEYVVSTLWSWPIDFLYGMGGILGISFSILERILGIFPIIVLGIWSVNKLFNYYKIERVGKWVGTLFYLTNTYILLVIDGGQLAIGLAYAWIPAAFLATIESIESGLKQKILAGLAISLLGFFDIRFIYVLAILILIHFLYDIVVNREGRRLKWVISWFQSGVIIGTIYLGLNSYWIFPAILAKNPTLPETYSRVSQTSFLSFTELKHSVSLLQPHWYKNIFGEIPQFRKEFLLIPILAFLAPLLKRKNKAVWFWVLVALVSVFLVKGVNPPFPEIYSWLFTNIPGFSLFRDSTKFFFLTALSYSVLIGFTADSLVKKLPGIKLFIFLALASYFVILARPVWLGQMTGIFSRPVYADEFFSLAKTIGDDKEYGKVLWIPSRAPLGYSSSTHPALDVLGILKRRPFAIGTVGAYETSNFIREASFMAEIFDIAGIKYIVYPYPDTRRVNLKKDDIKYHHVFLDQISSLSWIEGVKNFGTDELPLPLLKTKKSQDRFFIAPNTFFIVGSDQLYGQLVTIPNFGLAKNALIFLESEVGLSKKINEVKPSKVILYDKEDLDFLLSMTGKDDFIFPANSLDFDPNETGWWKREGVDLISWRTFLQEKYGQDNLDLDFGGNLAISEGQNELMVKVGEGEILFSRLMHGAGGGSVRFYQDGSFVGSVETKVDNPEKVKINLSGYKEIPKKVFEYDRAEFVWTRVGEIKSNSPLTIKTEGDINVINSLVILSKEEFKDLNEELKRLKEEKRIVYWEELNSLEKSKLFSVSTTPQVSYKRLSPTHYQVEIKGLSQSATLAFSETFDPLWKINDRGSYPLYTLINGFYIEEDGEYDVYFEPQKYVLPGFIISSFVIASLVVLLLV